MLLGYNMITDTNYTHIHRMATVNLTHVLRSHAEQCISIGFPYLATRYYHDKKVRIYRKRRFLSACAYCKISKKVCASILDALKYQYEIDHTHVWGWVRVVNNVQSLRAHGVKIEKVLDKR